MLFKKKKDQVFEELPDLLIVFDPEKKTSDVVNVTDINADSVTSVGLYKFPLDDCIVTNSIEGRNFFVNAPSEYIENARRLARLEKSMVLQQITQYKQPIDTGGADFTKIALVGIVILLIIVMGISSCSV